jgi:hypothetical protein
MSKSNVLNRQFTTAINLLTRAGGSGFDDFNLKFYTGTPQGRSEMYAGNIKDFLNSVISNIQLKLSAAGLPT